MRKTILALTLSLVSAATALAQQSTVVTTMASAESCRLTPDGLKALSGTGGHFAFHTTQRSDWSQFHLSDTNVTNLTTDQLYTLTPGSSADCVWVKNYAGELMTSIGNGSPAAYSAEATTGVDLYIVGCGTTPHPNFGDKQLRLDNAQGRHLRIHGNDFTDATGDWTRYVAYGPFYAVTVRPTSGGESVGQPYTLICSEGTLSYTLPTIDGYKPVSTTLSISVDADKTVDVEYAAYRAATPSELNLTPWPKEVELFDGSYTLPATYTISVAGLTDKMKEEATRFIDVITATTGKTGQVSTTAGKADITLQLNDALSNEGYNVSITTDGIAIEAATPAGFFYGLQTVKKLLPANVMAGTAPTAPDADYALPCINLSDEPRFGFRSFMLDCSRHFFTVEEIKRMLDVMAIYKMNTFHWHLTDDQGWRAEIEAYPELTGKGATRSKNWTTPITEVDGKWLTGEGTWDNTQYGPYYYSKKDMRDIVAYAAERHIEIIPEIEMPGHAVAALAAYPSLSCNPSATYNVWTNGGISSEVMNVMNPDVITFLHTVIDEMCDVFPGRYFHIGGDECPTSAWSNHPDCQSYMQKNDLNDVREIQSLFINHISQYLREQHDKTTIVWNESITAANANKQLVAQHKPVIMCWSPCQSGASQAAALGLDAIITEYHGAGGGYYINRRQSADYGEPTGAGAGDDTVEGCYKYVPVPASVSAENAEHYIGVQGTFWTEHVDSDVYLEYLALPRLICLAEAGWVRQDQKDWDSFVTRMLKDTEILDLGGYTYGRHWDPDYEHRVYISPIADGNIVTFTNQSSDRGRCLADAEGQLNSQGNECSRFVLEAVAGQTGQYYIRSLQSGKYLYAASTTKSSAVTLSDEKTAWTFDDTTVSGYVAICPAAATSVAINNVGSAPTFARLWDHGSGNGSSFWSVTKTGNVADNIVIPDGDVVTFTNIDTNRGRCLADAEGQLNAQATRCTNFVLVPVEGQDDQFYICSELTGKYLYVSGTAKDLKVSLSYTDKTAWTFDRTTKEGAVALCPVGSSFAINNNDTTATHARLWDHGSANDSSFWIIGLVGDADGNGDLTIGDVTYTIGILHGVKDSNTGADADASGAVNVDDVTKIANKVIRK